MLLKGEEFCTVVQYIEVHKKQQGIVHNAIGNIRVLLGRKKNKEIYQSAKEKTLLSIHREGKWKSPFWGDQNSKLT